MTVKRERFYGEEIDVVVLLNLIHPPVHLPDSHDTPFAPAWRARKSSARGDARGGGKKGRSPRQIQEALPILVGGEGSLKIHAG